MELCRQTRMKTVMNAWTGVEDTRSLAVSEKWWGFGSLTYRSHACWAAVFRERERDRPQFVALSPLPEKGENTLIRALVITHHIFWQAVFPSEGLWSLQRVFHKFPLVHWPLPTHSFYNRFEQVVMFHAAQQRSCELLQRHLYCCTHSQTAPAAWYYFVYSFYQLQLGYCLLSLHTAEVLPAFV